jgi:hypothetical protein
MNSRKALLKFGNTLIEDHFNLACKINCEKPNEKAKAGRYIFSSLTDTIYLPGPASTQF